MKNLSIEMSIIVLMVSFSVVTASCRANLAYELPIDVPSVDTPSSVETLVPTLPPPYHAKETGTSDAENLRESFPYEEIENFGGVEHGKLSGIVFNSRRKTLFAVSDNGRLIEMDTDGALIQQKRLRKRADFEGIAYSPVTGMLYVAIEGEEVILEVNAETLNAVRNIPIDGMFDGHVLLAADGKGVEGITFVPPDSGPAGGTFYLVNQSNKLEGVDPSMVFECEISNDGGEPKARIIRYFSVGVTDLSGIHYVPSTRRLLILSDANDLLLDVTLSGQVLHAYPLPGSKQEGITVDDDGFLYIAQDTKEELLKFRPKYCETQSNENLKSICGNHR